MQIRPVDPTDFDQWLPLWEGYNAFYGRSGPTALPRSVTDTLWGRFFDPGEPVWAFVAEQDGRLHGLTHYLLHRRTSAVEYSCYLEDLFTAPDARGKGIGRALIAAVEARARDLGCGRLYWLTHQDNATARALYDQVATHHGFIVYRKDL